MKSMDYCVRDDSDVKGVSSMAEKLGLNGIFILSDKTVKSGKNTYSGLLVDEKSPEILKNKVRKSRKDYLMIAVEGNSDAINRTALETAEVDLLLPGRNAKIDVVMAKLAKDNNVMIAFEFGILLHSTLEERGRIFSQMIKNAQSVRKFRAPFAIVSGAQSEYGLRSPSELTAFGKLLGFEGSEIKKSMSDNALKENRKRLSGKWIRPGVEVDR